MKKNFIGIVCLLVLVLALAGCPRRQEAPAGPTTHTIVGLLPLTGALSTFGENSSEVAKLATADVNAWLEENNKDWRLELIIDDTTTDPPTALRKMTTWFGEGVKFFLGPQSSGEAREVLAFANANQIMFISPSSTAPGLAIVDDWLFRFCPSDALQGPAIAKSIQESGAQQVIFAWRGDTWGDGLQKATAEALGELGIQVYPQQLRFDPLLEDFTVQAATLNDYVKDLVAQGVALNEIGIAAISFEEIVPFLMAANAYPQLKQVTWFGSDGTAYSAALAGSPVAAAFALETKFISTKSRPAAETEQSRFEHVRQHIQNTLNRETDAYSYNTYDMVWSLAMAIDEAGYDAAAVKAILPRVANDWTKVYGAGGHLVLNDAGDRAHADFNLLFLNDKLEWELVGIYNSAGDAVTWEREIY